MDDEQKQQLDDILQKMIEQQSNGDVEGSHCEADDLLCKALVILGRQDIVTEYEKIGKYYA